jgi:hypothetical protein
VDELVYAKGKAIGLDRAELKSTLRGARRTVGDESLGPSDGEAIDTGPSEVLEEPEPEYASAEVIEIFRRHLAPCVIDETTCGWLRSIAANPSTVEFERVARLFVSKGLTEEETETLRPVMPKTKVGKDFDYATKLGFRVAFEMVDVNAEVRSIRLRRPVSKARRKELKSIALKAAVSKLVLANEPARELLRNRGKRPSGWRDRPLHVVIAEGESDFACACCEPDEAIRAVFGICGSGQWCLPFAAAIPEDAWVFIATDSDRPGNKYARDVAQTLVGHSKLYRWRPWDAVKDKSKFDLSEVFGLRGGRSHAA